LSVNSAAYLLSTFGFVEYSMKSSMEKARLTQRHVSANKSGKCEQRVITRRF